MTALDKQLRNQLARTILDARATAEASARKALHTLGVDEADAPGHLDAAHRELRRQLRAQARQLGDTADNKGRYQVKHLAEKIAYDQWHRMLFARFLAENDLLISPEHEVGVSLHDCEELARERGVRDGWEIAAQFTAKMLPQIFRADDPAGKIELAPEDRAALRDLVTSLAHDTFLADDALGWVYQFWQAQRKDEVNASGDKIGADEIAPVTQLFTEDYMVLFLLHNTLGAWWAGKQRSAVSGQRSESKTSFGAGLPTAPSGRPRVSKKPGDLRSAASAGSGDPRTTAGLQSEEECRQAVALPGVDWEYLRFIKDEKTKEWRAAAGAFDGWPKTAKELRLLDPCMGSGHFAVAELPIIVAMRVAEEGLSVPDAVEVVLRDNLFGLELDPRCTQIAAFNLALAAWKLGEKYRQLPPLNLACCGLGINARKEDWLKLAGRDTKLRGGMDQLFDLFHKAPDLGSLINPRRIGDLLVAEFHELQPLLEQALAREKVEAASSRLVVLNDQRQDAAATFVGYFDPDQTVAELTGNLPHWRQEGVTYFVTFRCADALPQGKLRQWQQELDAWLGAHPEPHDAATRAEFFRLFPQRLQDWLDAGYGECALARPACREVVEAALRHFDGQRYRLDEFVVAANHVHALVIPFGEHQLSDLLHSWKSYTANQINKRGGRTGTFWQKESFDHIVRSPASLGKFREYIRSHSKVEAASSRLSSTPGAQRQDAAATMVEAASSRLTPSSHAQRQDAAATLTATVGLDSDLREMGVTARGLAHAAEILATQFTLVATNVPYLGRGKQDDVLKDFCERHHPDAKADLATCFVERCLAFCAAGGTTALVTPQNWLFLGTFRNLRQTLFRNTRWNLVGKLGPAAFEDMNWWAANTVLTVLTAQVHPPTHRLAGVDVSAPRDPKIKALQIRDCPVAVVSQDEQLRNPDARLLLTTLDSFPLLEKYADGLQGVSPADYPHFGRFFWELVRFTDCRWWQSTIDETIPYGGRELVLCWNDDLRMAIDAGSAFVRGEVAWGKKGVVVRQMRHLPCSLYTGEVFDTNCAVVVPKDAAHLPAIWAFCSSDEFCGTVRLLDQKTNVTNRTLVKVPFDLAHWQKVAAEKYPHGLPKPHSDDPTQWLFNGHPKGSSAPLQVAVARLLGYHWPRQNGSSFPDCPALKDDGLEEFADKDGIVCVSPVLGEQPAAERLRALLAAASGREWSAAKQAELLAQADYAGETLEDWLRDGFLEQHCQLFHQRPFIWQVWDGLRDGFSVLVNYHRLDRKALEKLTYTYLGDWITRQKAAVAAGEEGSDAKLAAAQEAKAALEKIIEGEPPCDIFVRWKPLDKQPIGWDPDLNDGVRLNIRPFVEAGILRRTPKVNWNKDRGKDVASAPWYPKFKGERINDHHLTLDEKRRARRG